MFFLFLKKEYKNDGSFILNADPCLNIRLTRNIQTLFSPYLLPGIVSPVMSTVANCLAKYQVKVFVLFEVTKRLFFFKKEQLRWPLVLLMKEDLLAFQGNEKTMKMEDLKAVCEQNAQVILERVLHLVSPSNPIAIDQRVNELISMAINPKSLSEMDPVYYSWF